MTVSLARFRNISATAMITMLMMKSKLNKSAIAIPHDERNANNKEFKDIKFIQAFEQIKHSKSQENGQIPNRNPTLTLFSSFGAFSAFTNPPTYFFDSKTFYLL